MTSSIPLTRGRIALVDDDDRAAVTALGSWQLGVCDGRAYAQHSDRNGSIRLHTFLTGWPLVDHVNGDGLDNRRSNLRPATPSQNGANIGPPLHNTSGFKGVSLYRRTGRWRAYITVDQTHRHLGYFATAEDAARAYDVAALAAWGEYARLNIPERNPS